MLSAARHPGFKKIIDRGRPYLDKKSHARRDHFITSTTMSSTIKGISQSQFQHDGSALRVAIVHARWNDTVIKALLEGAVAKLKERGVKESNIVVESVPGSFELPLAAAKYVCFIDHPLSLF